MQGENGATEIVVDVSSVMESNPNAYFCVTACIPNRCGCDPSVNIPVAGPPDPLLPDAENKIHYTVENNVTANHGGVLLEFSAMDGGVLILSSVFPFVVLEGVRGKPCKIPNDVITRIFEIGLKVQEAANAAIQAGESAAEFAQSAAQSADEAREYAELASQGYSLFAAEIDPDGYLYLYPTNDGNNVGGYIDDGGNLSITISIGGEDVA
jgi:hypothetical protein